MAWLGVPERLATAVMLGFVLLGDFRVYWLLFAVALRDVRRGARLAAAVTPVVPLLAYASDHLLRTLRSRCDRDSGCG